MFFREVAPSCVFHFLLPLIIWVILPGSSLFEVKDVVSTWSFLPSTEKYVLGHWKVMFIEQRTTGHFSHCDVTSRFLWFLNHRVDFKTLRSDGHREMSWMWPLLIILKSLEWPLASRSFYSEGDWAWATDHISVNRCPATELPSLSLSGLILITHENVSCITHYAP